MRLSRARGVILGTLIEVARQVVEELDKGLAITKYDVLGQKLIAAVRKIEADQKGDKP